MTLVRLPHLRIVRTAGSCALCGLTPGTGHNPAESSLVTDGFCVDEVSCRRRYRIVTRKEGTP